MSKMRICSGLGCSVYKRMKTDLKYRIVKIVSGLALLLFGLQHPADFFKDSIIDLNLLHVIFAIMFLLLLVLYWRKIRFGYYGMAILWFLQIFEYNILGNKILFRLSALNVVMEINIAQSPIKSVDIVAIALFILVMQTRSIFIESQA